MRKVNALVQIGSRNEMTNGTIRVYHFKLLNIRASMANIQYCGGGYGKQKGNWNWSILQYGHVIRIQVHNDGISTSAL